MKRNVIILCVTALAVLTMALVRWGHVTDIPGGTKASLQKGSQSNNPFGIASIFSSPIAFYGRVLTQDGVPISGADVRASVADKFGGASSKIITQSDQQGLFSITTAGMTLSVQVFKDGYFPIPEGKLATQRSSGAFDYGVDFGNGIHKPNPLAPVVFTLFMPPALESLNRIREKETMMPRDGNPVTVSLDSFDRKLELKFLVNDANKEEDGRYDWKLEVSAINGSIKRRTGDFDFTAPAGAYRQCELIDMPRTLKRPDWHDDFEQSYWLHFDDGTFGSVRVRMIAGGACYSIVSRYLNPKSGSRNLATDPSKQR